MILPQISGSILLDVTGGTERGFPVLGCFRHTFAMQLLDKGVDIYTIAALLGHRQVSSTQNYAKMTSRKMIEAIVKIE